MARYTAHALVIGVHPWGDADKVVELFTAEKGRVRAAAFGSRRPKSALAAALQLFNEVWLVRCRMRQRIPAGKAARASCL